MSAVLDPTTLRIASELARYRPLLDAARRSGADETETLALVECLLCDVFGYDHDTQISAEVLDRGTCNDLALQLGGRPTLLIEAQPAGRPFGAERLARAVEHATAQGCEWLALTDSAFWQVYRVDFGGPIEPDRVLEFDLLEVDITREAALEPLRLFTRESWQEGWLAEWCVARRLHTRHAIAAALLTEPVLRAIRRELCRVTPELEIDTDEIALTLCCEVLAPETLLGANAEDARSLLRRATPVGEWAIDDEAPAALAAASATEFELREAPGEICS